MPGAPATCAEDEEADHNPAADVSQATKTVYPDFGIVPQGGEFTGNPAEPGPYQIYEQGLQVPIVEEIYHFLDIDIEVAAGEINATIYYPEAGGQLLDGPLPLVIVLQGFQGPYYWYESYSHHIASHGFAVMGLGTRTSMVAAAQHREAVEVMQAINWISESSDSPLQGRIDMTRIATAGHSVGGKVSFYAAALDNRIDLVIGWDPSNNGGPSCAIGEMLNITCDAIPAAPNCQSGDPGIEHFMAAESLVLGMPRDSSVNPDRHHNSIHFYRGAPSPALLVYMDSTHVSPLPLEVGGITIMGSPTVVRINKSVQMSLLLKRFKGMTGAGLDRWLPDTRAGVANLLSEEIVIRAEAK